MSQKKSTKEDFNFAVWTTESIQMFIDVTNKPYFKTLPLSYKFIIFCQVNTTTNILDCWIFFQFMLLYCDESMSVETVLDLWKEFISHPNCLLAISLNEQDIDQYVQETGIQNLTETTSQMPFGQTVEENAMEEEQEEEIHPNNRITNIFSSVTNIGFKHDYSQYELIFLHRSIPLLIDAPALCEKEKCIVTFLKAYLEKFFMISF